jgi:hypothetical protein
MFINRPFYLVSRLPMKRVAEVKNYRFLLKRYTKGRMTQQFYFDGKSKTIRLQQWKNYCVEMTNKSILRATSTITSRFNQMFRYQGNMMVNEHGGSWDITNNVDAENGII